MTICCVADLHGNLVDIPECDLLLIAGDICPARDHSIPRQAEWLDDPFRRWLERVPAKHVVGIAGNHDFIFEQAPERVPQGLRWTYLQDSEATVAGVRIFGTPWQPWFYDWAFNLYEPQLRFIWEAIPEGIDVLLVHGPPNSYGDLTERGDHAGSPSLLERIRQVKPRLVVSGHIHEARGQWELETDGNRPPVRIINCSVVDVRYRCVHPPVLVEMEI